MSGVVVVIVVLASAVQCRTNPFERTSSLEGFQHPDPRLGRWDDPLDGFGVPGDLRLDVAAQRFVPSLQASPGLAQSVSGRDASSSARRRKVSVMESPWGARLLPERRRYARAVETQETRSDDPPGSDPSGTPFESSNVFVHRLWPVLQDLVVENSITSSCVSSLLMTYAGIRNDDLWALKFQDSSGKTPSALLEGTTSSLGSYDECLSIRSPTVVRDGSTFTGRYCVLHWNSSGAPMAGHNRNTSRSLDEEHFGEFRLGVCIPSECTGDHLRAILSRLTDRHASVSVASCRARGDISVSQVQVAIICLLITWCTAVLLSTLIHLYRMKKNLPKTGGDSVVTRTVLALSAITSTRALFKPEAADSPRRILHGLKVASLLWILLGQTYELQSSQVLARPAAYFLWKDNPLYSVVVNWTLSFTTLFFVGGVTASTVLLEKLEGHAGILRLTAVVLLRRYIALTIAALFIVALFVLYPLMLDGPVADGVLPQTTETCRQRWWTVPLHINNLNGLDKICYRPLWYISCQFQLCLAIVLPIIILVKHPNIGSTLMAAALFALIVGTYVQASTSGYHPITALLPGFDTRAVSKTLSSFFYMPFLHAPASILGAVVGYWAVTNKDGACSKVSHHLCWIVACGGLTSAIFSSFLWERWFRDANPAIFLVGPRLAWMCGVGWMVHACLTNRTCILSRALSGACFVPLGRLHLLAYLVSAMVTQSATLGARELIYASHSVVLRQFLANVVLSYAVAYVCYVLCGGPADALRAAVWKLYGSSEKKKSWDELDKKVRFLSELLGPQPGGPPCKDRPTPMRRIASLRDMVVCRF